MVEDHLSSRKEMSRTPLIIGHRGASAYAPENTLAAFRLALEAGADGVEFDVQLAKDGVPVVIHDSTLKRTGGRRERVAELTSNEVAGVDVGSWFNSKHRKRAREEFATQTVPTLVDVLGLVKDSNCLLYIELKCDETSYKPLAKAVCDLIRDSPMLSRMIVKSFRLAAVAEVRCQVPVVQTAALFEPSITNILSKRKYMVAMAREFGAHQLSLHRSLATPKLTELAAQAGMPVTIWTADNLKWIERSRGRAITALITNDPQKLLSARDRRS